MTRLLIGVPEGGQRPAGWTVVGLTKVAHLQLDVAHEPLPLPDNSVDVAVVVHELQRVAPDRVAFVLSELRRVIKPGGWRACADGSAPFEGGLVRLMVPDLSAACRAYVDGNVAFFGGPGEGEVPLGARLSAWLQPGGNALGLGLGAMDHETLAWSLKRQGFEGTYRSAYRKSVLPELRVEGVDARPNDSVYLEAWKARNAA